LEGIEGAAAAVGCGSPTIPVILPAPACFPPRPSCGCTGGMSYVWVEQTEKGAVSNRFVSMFHCQRG